MGSIVAQHLTGTSILSFAFLLLYKRRRYRDYVTGWTVRGSNPGRGKKKFFPLLQNAQDGLRVSAASYSVGADILSRK